MQIILRP